jgi:predicted nucleotidyltransferase component of viral defense system
MSRQPLSHLARSIHQRLLNRAHEQQEDPNLVFIRFAMERLLYRLSCSAHRERFVLKGAMLFALWTDQIHRPTRDLDLLGMGDASDEAMVKVFREIISTEVEADGLDFDPEGISIAEIREAQEYAGKRLKIPARLGNTALNLQVDIGFGDAITPAACEVKYPTLLDLPAPKIKAYPYETVIAEKLEAMVALGTMTSRMKDFYDLWMMSQTFTFKGSILTQAIVATFDRRRTAIPKEEPVALSIGFSRDETKQTQWKAFLSRNKFSEIPFSKVIEDLRVFLLKPLQAAEGPADFPKNWPPCGPWG